MNEQSGTRHNYLTVANGKITDKKSGKSGFSYTGYLLEIDIVDNTFEGKTTKRVEVKLKDDKTDELSILQFTRNAWFAQGFFARIFKVDVSKPLTIGVSGSEDNEKISFCWIKQEGLSYVNKEGKKVEAVEAHATFPKPIDVDLGEGEGKVKSWAPVVPAMDKVVAQVKKALLEKGIKPPVVATPAPVATAPVEPPVAKADSWEPPIDDLPF